MQWVVTTEPHEVMAHRMGDLDSGVSTWPCAYTSAASLKQADL